MTPLIATAVRISEPLDLLALYSPRVTQTRQHRRRPTTTSAYMNASIALEAFGSPSIPSGLMRVLERIRPGDNAPKIAAGKSTIAVKRANHRQRALGNLPLGNSRSK